MPDLINIITNTLKFYTGIPDFYIKELKQINDTTFYACYFEDETIINFRYPQDGFSGKLLAISILEQYLKESNEQGMNTK